VVYIQLCRIYSYSGCKRLKQSSEATFKVSRISIEVNTSGEAHASEVHTPLKDTTPNHRIATTIQLPTLIYDVGTTSSYPHISTALAGLTNSGERRSTRKVCLARISDLRTVHNQWTQTTTIALNTLQRLYNCTRTNRTETGRHRFHTLLYG
jgi:hypothetical protein